MYINLGQNAVVKDSDILGIFDIDNTTVTESSKKYLSKAEKNGDAIIIGSQYDIPNTFIVCETNNYRTVYLSPSSTATIFKRTKTVLADK